MAFKKFFNENLLTPVILLPMISSGLDERFAPFLRAKTLHVVEFVEFKPWFIALRLVSSRRIFSWWFQYVKVGWASNVERSNLLSKHDKPVPCFTTPENNK